MAKNRQDIDDVSPSSEQPSIGIVSGKSNFGAESDAASTNVEHVAVTKPSECPSIPDNPNLHVGDEDHKGPKKAAMVDLKYRRRRGIIPCNSDYSSGRKGHSSTKTDKKAQKRKALSTTHNNVSGLDVGADGGTSDETDESNPVTEQQIASFRPSTHSLVSPPPASGLGQSEGAWSRNEYIQSKGDPREKSSVIQPSSQYVLSLSQPCREPLTPVPSDLPNACSHGSPPPRPLLPSPPASGLGLSEGAAVLSLDDDTQSKGAVGGNGSENQPSSQYVLSPSQHSPEPLPPVPSDLLNEFSPGIPPTRPLLSPPPAFGLGQSEGAVASILYDDIQSKGAVGGSGSDHQPSSQRVFSPSLSRHQPPQPVPSHLPSTFPSVPPSPSPSPPRLPLVEGAHSEQARQQDILFTSGVLQLRPNIAIDSRESPFGDEGSRSVDLERTVTDWTDGRDRPQEPDEASQDHAGRHGEIMAVTDVIFYQNHLGDEVANADGEEANIGRLQEQHLLEQGSIITMSDLSLVYGWGDEQAVNGNIQPLNNRRSTCLNCGQRSADMRTLNCHCQVLCQLCAYQVIQCPGCEANIVAVFRCNH